MLRFPSLQFHVNKIYLTHAFHRDNISQIYLVYVKRALKNVNVVAFASIEILFQTSTVFFPVLRAVVSAVTEYTI